jgi:ribonuclease R
MNRRRSKFGRRDRGRDDAGRDRKRVKGIRGGPVERSAAGGQSARGADNLHAKSEQTRERPAGKHDRASGDSTQSSASGGGGRAKRPFGGDASGSAGQRFGGNAGDKAGRGFGGSAGSRGGRRFGGDASGSTERRFGGNAGDKAGRGFGGSAGSRGGRRFGGKSGGAAGRRFGGKTGGTGGRSGRGPSGGRTAGDTVISAGGLVEGKVSAHRAGYGFLRVEGASDSIFLPPREMRGLMHGDRALVRVSRDASDRWLGEVEGVVARGVNAFLGTVEVHGRSAWVTAADRRLQLRCTVAPADLNGARNGDWVIAQITRHASNGTPPQARVQKRLDPDRPVELSTESAIARFELPCEFSAAALREAQAFGDKVDPREVASRVDLRDMPLVTIDGEDARDFDDAVYAEPHPAGFRLVVAIADVSHYVRPSTAIDAAAVERGTSVYFPTRVLPMLPTALSDHLCSLAPKVDRLCFVADMIITKQGALKSATFYPATMRSAARLTYTLANDALFEGKPAARNEIGSLLDKLMVLVEVYRALYKARSRRGALEFDAAEAEFVIDSAERVRAIELRVRNDAHRLIEECMICANVAVARELEKSKTPSLYRVHGEPEEQKVERLVGVLASLNIDARLPEKITTRDLQAITSRLKDTHDRPFIESLIVRAMPQAIYQPENIGHFGLALTQYAHFTSPIRRYPDLVVHRTLKALIGDKSGAAVRYDGTQLAVMGESTSRLEKRADEADRYVATFLKCTYLRERIGQTFRGLITTVVEFGCFVQILDAGVDGLLHVDTLRDDQYAMSDDGHAWIGRRNRRQLRTGNHISVIVTAVNPIEGLIDLELAGDAENDADGDDADEARRSDDRL